MRLVLFYFSLFENLPRDFVYVIGLHAVQFRNNWMRKTLRTSKLDEAYGLVQFGSPRNFLNPVISKLDKHVVLLPIKYIASVLLSYLCIKSAKNVVKFVFGNLFKLSHFASLSTPQVEHFNPGFSASLSILVLIILFSLISSKSVASISGNLPEDSSESLSRQTGGGEKSREIQLLSKYNKTQRATIAH